jgi:muramoyltetrapeptide carboxypeptidase
MGIISEEIRSIAHQRFTELGLQLSFGKHVEEKDDFNSSSVISRLEDLHDAFADPKVKGILTVVGGFNSNQLLSRIDWSLIKSSPKVFCGYSDITALNNAILAKTGLITYSGLHYSTFGMQRYFDYCLEYFKKCVMDESPFEITPSKEWTDDMWFMNQSDRHPIVNEGWLIINEGEAEGTICGGNLCTFNLLQGTNYMPNLNEVILFLEDDAESQPHHFDRDLTSLIQQPNFAGVLALAIGRFQRDSHMTSDLLKKIVASKPELARIPVIANVDFGHTNTIVSYPIGGSVSLVARQDNSRITITRH